MLVIRQKQIDTVVMGDEEDFIGYIVSHEKLEHPELAEKHSPEELREMARAGIRRAEGYGFESSDDIMAFIGIMFEIAPNFDDQPEIKAVLDNEAVPAQQRFDNLWSPMVPDEVWEKAEEDYDEKAWIPKEKDEQKVVVED